MNLTQGAVCCRGCSRLEETAALDRASLDALRYIKGARAKQLFSFSLPDISLAALSKAAERYLLLQTERRFSTLEYWKKLRIK